MLWPPSTTQPASWIFSAPPLRICSRSSISPAAGHARIERAVSGVPAHGVDVAERVRRGDGSERERIVDNRSEKIDRLHQRHVGRQTVHSGVVGGIEADQNIGIFHARYAREHLVQDLWTQFRRSTRGFHVRRQFPVGHLLQFTGEHGGGKGANVHQRARRRPPTVYINTAAAPWLHARSRKSSTSPVMRLLRSLCDSDFYCQEGGRGA